MTTFLDPRLSLETTMKHGVFSRGLFLEKLPPNPRKDVSTDNAASSIVILSLGNPSAAGTQRRQALQECPVVLVGMTACVITRKLRSVEAMLDTAAFLTWRDCPWALHQ